MRKEIGWNAGMHSHPRFLNKPLMNEVNTGEEKTTTTHMDVDHPERKSNQDVFVCTQSHYVL